MKSRHKSLFAALAVLVLVTLACSLLPGETATPVAVPPTGTAALAPPATDSPAPPTPTVTPSIPTATAFPLILSPVITSLRMFDAVNGWAIADQYVLRTADGGINWVSVTPAGVTGLGHRASAWFMDVSTAWVLTPLDETSGTLYQTTNGGLGWSAFAVPFSNGFIQFVDAANGYVLTSLGGGAGSQAVALYRTYDGGVTWLLVFVNDPNVAGSSDSLPLGGQKVAMHFLDVDRGWVGGAIPVDGFTYLYATMDGGVTWNQVVLALPPGFETSMTEVSAPRFFNATEGILQVRLISGIPSTVFYMTFDGGLTWGRTFPINAYGRHSFASVLDVFLWDGGPALYFSYDSGLTWNAAAPNIDVTDTLMSMQFVDRNTGWVLTGDADDHHPLYVTRDGGTTWTALIP